eukprot:18719-Heterococcus_DN1.PRE.3
MLLVRLSSLGLGLRVPTKNSTVFFATFSLLTEDCDEVVAKSAPLVEEDVLQVSLSLLREALLKFLSANREGRCSLLSALHILPLLLLVRISDGILNFMAQDAIRVSRFAHATVDQRCCWGDARAGNALAI